MPKACSGARGKAKAKEGKAPLAVGGVAVALPDALPATLPASCPIPVEGNTTNHYGVSWIKHKHHKASVIKALMPLLAQLRVWCCTPVNLARRGVGHLSAKSWLKEVTNIKSYLGFAYHYHGMLTPTLSLYLDASMVMAFLAFLIYVRGADVPTLRSHTYTGYRVCVWLSATGMLATSPQQVQRLLDWYKGLHAQLDNLPRVPGRAAAAPSFSPALLTAAVVGMVKRAIARVAVGDKPTMVCAVLVQAALFSSCFWAYMPTLRPSVVASLQVAGLAYCQHPCCLRPATCLGNRVFRKQGKWWVAVVHHKNEKKWKNQCLVEFPIPAALQSLMSAFVCEYRQLLMPIVDEHEHPFLFCVPSTGKPMCDTDVSTQFARGIRAYTSWPADALVPSPQSLRSVFVGELRASGVVVDEQAVARIMGNSTAVWDAVYDRQHAARCASGAIEKMDAVRSCMALEI